MDLTQQTRRTILISVVLSAVTVAVFWPVTGHDFIICDDPGYVTLNIHVLKGLNWEDVVWACRTGYQANWHPVSWLSHMLDVQLFGVRPGWHHLTSLLFHAANAVLLFLLLQRMTGAAWRSAMVAALFALHPLHVESVAWVAERKDVLSAFFFMLTVWAYAKYVEKSEIRNQKSEGNPKAEIREAGGSRQESALGNPQSVSGFTFHVSRFMRPTSVSHLPSSIFYLLSLSCFALGLMSKPMLVTVPFVLLLLDYWPLRRLEDQSPESKVQSPEAAASTTDHGLRTTDHPTRFTFHVSRITLLPLLVEKLPFIALSAVSCVVTLVAQSSAGAVSSLAGVTLTQRVSNALVAYVTYLAQMVWPTGLTIFYPLRSQLPLEAAGAGAVLLGITAWAIAGTQAAKGSAASCLPARISGMRPNAFLPEPRRPHLVVGWFWYLGMLVPVIGLVQVGAQQMADRYTYLPLIGVFIMLVWEVAGWSGSVAGRTASSVPPVRQQVPELPISPVRDGALGTARPAFATRVACGIAAGVVLVACAALTRRQVSWWQDSERLFRHALDVTRDNYMAHNNLAGDFYFRGKWDEAIEHYQTSLAMQPLQPRQLDVRRALGETLSKRGRYEEAAEQFEEVLRVRPDDVAALVQLGIARARQGKSDEAVQALSEALRLQPNDAAAHNGLGNVLAQQGRHEEAVRQFEETVRLQPDHAGALNNLAISCKRLGRISEAIAHYREALRLRPDALEALNNLAWMLAAHPEARYRNGAEAVELATRACELTRYQNPIPLTTLAAASGEAGKFHEAVSFAEQAQTLLGGSNNAVAARLRAMLEAFRAGQPYHGE